MVFAGGWLMLVCWGWLMLVWCWWIQRRNQTFLKKLVVGARIESCGCWVDVAWEKAVRRGIESDGSPGWQKKTASVKAMLRRRGKIIGQLVWQFRPLLVGTALWRMQSTSDWTQFCHRGHISWYQLMTHATHKIFPTGSESLPVCCKKTTGPP